MNRIAAKETLEYGLFQLFLKCLTWVFWQNCIRNIQDFSYWSLCVIVVYFQVLGKSCKPIPGEAMIQLSGYYTSQTKACVVNGNRALKIKEKVFRVKKKSDQSQQRLGHTGRLQNHIWTIKLLAVLVFTYMYWTSFFLAIVM